VDDDNDEDEKEEDEKEDYQGVTKRIKVSNWRKCFFFIQQFSPFLCINISIIV
jgi:hypothetical protein